MQVWAVRVCFRVFSLCGYFIQECVCSAAGLGLTGRYSGGTRGDMSSQHNIGSEMIVNSSQEGVN